MLSWINDELRLTPKSFHRLIHLLGIEYRYIPIELTADPQGRSRDLGDVVEWRDLFPGFGVFPGKTEFLFPTKLIVIVTVV